MAENIRIYLVAARGLTREEFGRAYPDPVLVLSPLSEVEKSGPITRAHREDGSVAFVPFEVARVKKRAGANQFKSMITLGRSETNDIDVRAPEVSKFHAYFIVEPEGVLLGDAGSTNGTSVRGEPVPPKTRRRLRAGDELSFGGARVVFHDPTSFYELLRAALAEQAQPAR